MSLRPVIRTYGIEISDKSHKEGPATVGGCLMRLQVAKRTWNIRFDLRRTPI